MVSLTLGFGLGYPAAARGRMVRPALAANADNRIYTAPAIPMTRAVVRYAASASSTRRISTPGGASRISLNACIQLSVSSPGPQGSTTLAAGQRHEQSGGEAVSAGGVHLAADQVDRTLAIGMLDAFGEAPIKAFVQEVLDQACVWSTRAQGARHRALVAVLNYARSRTRYRASLSVARR